MTTFASNPFSPSAFSRSASPFSPPTTGGFRRRTNLKFRALVDSGPEAIEEEVRAFLGRQPIEKIEENPRASWQTALEVLDTPGNIVRNAIYRPLGIKGSSRESFAGLPKVYGSDALQAAGWKPDSTIGKVSQFIAGLGMDFLTDPFTWLAGFGGAALGTVVAGAPGAVGGWAAGTSAVKWFQGVSRGAQKLGKGVSVLKAVDESEGILSGAARAAARVHVKPEGLGRFEELVSGFEKAGHRDPITAAAEAFQKSNAELTYNSRLGFGFGTSVARNLPLGHLILGPPLIAGKAVTTVGELTGQAVSKIPVIGKMLGKPIEMASRAAQVPLDLAGAASDVVGTPLKYLPQADKFTEVGKIPGVGRGVKWLSETLQASDAAVNIGGSLKKLGGEIKDAAAKAGIGPKTPLAALILDRISGAQAGIRKDVNPGGILYETQQILTDASGSTQIPERELNAVSVIAAEGVGEITKAMKGQAPGPTVARVFEQIRIHTQAALGETASIETVMRSTEEIMASITKRTGVDLLPKGPGESLRGDAVAPPATTDIADQPSLLPRKDRKIGLENKRFGLKAARKVLSDMHDGPMADLLTSDSMITIDPEQFASASELLLPGYTFANADEFEELAWRFTPDQLKRLKAQGMMKIDPQPGRANWEDTSSTLTEVVGDGERAREMMAQSMIEGLGYSPGEKADRVVEFLRKTPELSGPEDLYNMRVYERIRDGELVITKSPRKGKPAIESETLGIPDLKQGEWVTIAGEPFEIKEVGRKTVKDQEVPYAKLVAGREEIDLGADSMGFLPDKVVVDKGSRQSPESRRQMVAEVQAAEELAERYRSPIHQQAGQAAREAGLVEEQASLFDAALSDIDPERLKGLDVKAMEGDFAGLYDKARKAVVFGRGNLNEATEAIHEIGHFAWDYIFAKTDQDVFRKWWQTKPVKERIGAFRRGEGADSVRNRYLAGDPSMTRADLKSLGMTPEDYGAVLKDPSREGFAQQFAYYAMTRRAGSSEFGSLFEKAMDLVRRLWKRMRGQGDANRQIADLFESIFDTEKRMAGKDLPDAAVHLELQGMQFGDLSMDYKAGKNGKVDAASRYARKAVTAEHAGKLVSRLKLDDPSKLILVPVPSATGQNNIPEAMSRRLAALTGGKARKLLESNIVQQRPGKGVLRRLANPRQFVSAEFPGDLPAGAVVVLVDDTMHAGSSLRDAARQLTRSGVTVAGSVVGRTTGSRRTSSLRASHGQITEISSRIGQEGMVELERVIGRKIDPSSLTAAEAEELGARFASGWTVDDIDRLMIEARKSPGLPDEALDPSVINKTSMTELDDIPPAEDRMLERLRERIESGVMKPTWTGAKEYAKSLTKPEKLALFGAVRITDANPRVRHEVELAMLRLGHGVRNMGWEGVFEALANVESGRPGRIAAGLERPGGLIERTTVEGRDTLSLTSDGKLALKAIRESIQYGGDPSHVERLTIELQQLEARRMQILRAGRPVTPNIWHRIKLKRRILKNMGKSVTDDPAYRNWVAAREAEKAVGGASSPSSPDGIGTPPPPATPGVAAAADDGPRIRMPTPEEMYTPAVAKLVRQTHLLRSDTEALERAGGVVTPQLDTHRGLGYFPHYLGDAKSVVGKAIRASGMAWEAEIKRMQTLPGELRQTKKGPRTAKQMLDAVIKQENKLRSAKGKALIESPAADTPIGQAMAQVLAENPDLRPYHASQLRRTFLHELTVQEINSLAEYTGVAFKTNVVEVYKARRTMAHLAVAGVDFLRSAIRMGVDDGWVVEVKGKGQVPEGFERITDRRFGNIAKGYAFSKDVAREFRKFQGFSEKPHVVLRALDWITDQWRTSVLGVAPYTMSNLLGGVFQSNIFNAFRYKTWGGVRDMMMDIHKGVPNRTVGKYVKGLPKGIAGQDIQEFYELLSVTHGELGKGQYGIEMERAVKDGIRTEWGVLSEFMLGVQGKTLGEKAARGLAGAYRDESGLHLRLGESAYFRAFRSFNVAVEDWMAMGFITERLRQGDDLAMAITKKRLALNQSADLTDFEQNFFRRLIPFWGWMKGNAILQFTAALARPQLAGAVPKIRGNLESALVGDENLAPSLRPRHVSEELGVQLTGGVKPEFVNATRLFPVREIGLTPLSGPLGMGREVAGEVIQRINPTLKVPAENVINRDLYWDRKIEEYPEQQRRFLGVNMPPGAKRLARLVRQLNVVEQVSWRGVPSSVSEAGFGVAQSAGVRVFPVDIARQVNAQQRALNDQGGAVMRDMHRARLRAERSGRNWQSDPEVIRLSRVYADLMDQRDALPFKALRESSAAYLKERRGQRSELREFARN